MQTEAPERFREEQDAAEGEDVRQGVTGGDAAVALGDTADEFRDDERRDVADADVAQRRRAACPARSAAGACEVPFRSSEVRGGPGPCPVRPCAIQEMPSQPCVVVRLPAAPSVVHSTPVPQGVDVRIWAGKKLHDPVTTATRSKGFSRPPARLGQLYTLGRTGACDCGQPGTASCGLVRPRTTSYDGGRVRQRLLPTNERYTGPPPQVRPQGRADERRRMVLPIACMEHGLLKRS